MPDLADVLDDLRQLEGVDDAVAAARDSCTQLRWHPALRRRIPEAAAESRIRGAWASASLDGVNVPLELVRGRMMGAQSPRQDASQSLIDAATRLGALGEELPRLIIGSPLQAVARAHTVALAGIVAPETLGRPRQEGQRVAEELAALPAPPDARDAAARLHQVMRLTELSQAPAVLVAALVHAEVVASRPFERANAMLARAFERAILIGRGVDPTGVAVPEAGYLRLGVGAYAGALRDYIEGGADGVRQWLIFSAGAITEGAAEGGRIADAVLAGKLTGA